MQRGIFVTLVEYRLFYLQGDRDTGRHKQDVCARERGDTDVSSRTVPWLTIELVGLLVKCDAEPVLQKNSAVTAPFYNSTNPNLPS